MKANILGTEYDVKLGVPYNEESMLGFDGYTDDTSKVIAISDCGRSNYGKLQEYKDRVLLHEIVHSFMNECGLTTTTCDWHCEEMVEWCAIQIPRIMNVYDRLNGRDST